MQIDELIHHALTEDFAFDDITSNGCVDPKQQITARLLVKQEGVIAGLPFLAPLFLKRDPELKCELLVEEGAYCPSMTFVAQITGSAHSILSAERSALNLVQHLSGIATLTAQCVALTKGTQCQILDTRKTLPGYRELQKYAVRIGGGINHRLHLADRILIKNTHIGLSSLIACVQNVRLRYPEKPIEVEVSTFAQFEEALKLNVERVLLDNMSPEEISHCVKANKKRLFLEASGGITLATLSAYAATGVNAISIGALTHSAPALDISLRISSCQN